MKRSISRLPVSRARASSTSRSSSSTQPRTPSLTRSKSSLSLRRTPTTEPSSSKIRAKKKDARPIQDKNWQAVMLKRTQEYFQKSYEGRQLLNKGLNIKPITLKMFVELTNVVLKNIDATFEELTLANYTQLLPFHLNKLMYPGVVTASTLKTANTMHSWPHILGIMSWLVEFNELSMMVNVEEIIFDIPSDAPFNEQIKKSENELLFDFFKQWNSGSDIENQNEKILNMYKKLCNLSDADLDNCAKQYNKLNEELKDTVEKLDNDEQIIETLEEEYNKAAYKLKHITKSIQSEKQSKNDYITKMTETKNANEILARKINETESSIEKLKGVIKKQPMDQSKRAQIEQENDDLRREIELFEEKAKYKLSLRDEKDLKLSEARQNIKQFVHTHNLELMRPALEHSEIKQIELREDNLLHSDLKEYIKEKSEIQKKLMNDLEMKITAAQDQIATLQHKKENIQQHIKSIDNKSEEENRTKNMLTQKYESTLKQKQQIEKQIEDEISELKQEILKIKEQNNDLKATMESTQSQMNNEKANCDEIKTKLDEKHLKMEQFFEQLLTEFRTNQAPRYDRIKRTIMEKIDKAVEHYTKPPAPKKK